MATKRKSNKTGSKGGRKKDGSRKRPPSDTPITVGGGGGGHLKRDPRNTFVRFDHGHYGDHTPAGDQEKHYSRPGEKINFLEFKDGNGATQDLTRYLGDQDVLLKFQNSNQRVKITQDPFGVRFRSAKYPQQADSDDHICETAILETIVMKSKTLDKLDVGLGLKWTVRASKIPGGAPLAIKPRRARR